MQHKFDFNIKQGIWLSDMVLMHAEWQVSAPQQMTMQAIACSDSIDGTETSC
ncbi:MAG: hypothetical protein HY785_00720 [Oscillatoriophycideae cyanobacterium NC_groundwater_1537_Pr4_S-0.65um_50_18]|nr:hypothetical protein [Oscillatoriophycideae cyanobacterium NC_groundwater_1537_Pr4_S-0.65um_50_18]